MKEDALSIMKWSEETFPDATLSGQSDKFATEFEEWKKSGYKDISELADMTIVACSIRRFDERTYLDCLNIINMERSKYGITAEMLNDAVNKKMQKNRKRKWEYKNGNYQHKEEK